MEGITALISTLQVRNSGAPAGKTPVGSAGSSPAPSALGSASRYSRRTTRPHAAGLADSGGRRGIAARHRRGRDRRLRTQPRQAARRCRRPGQGGADEESEVAGAGTSASKNQRGEKSDNPTPDPLGVERLRAGTNSRPRKAKRRIGEFGFLG